MRRGIVLCTAALAGCSLLTSLDGLQGTGTDAGVDAPADVKADVAAPVDAATDVFVPPPSSATALDVGAQLNAQTSGAHACVLAGVERAVFCWGAGDFGQIGNGAIGDVTRATKILLDSDSVVFTGIDTVTVGSWNTCARKGALLYCWGLRQQGGVADGVLSTTPQSLPKSTLGGISDIALGGAHGCFVKAGELDCWGHGHNDQLGVNGLGLPGCTPFFDTNGNCSATPVKAAGISTPPLAVSLGVAHSCVLTALGNVQCWGYNGDRATGIEGGSVLISGYAPVSVNTAPSTPLGGVAQLSSRGRHNCALRTDKTVWCWGQNDAGQLGRTISAASPYAAQVAGLAAGVLAVGVGERASCAVTAGAEVQCWGDDTFGQLGDGNVTASATPVFVKGPGGVGKLGNVKSVAAAYGFACALTNDKSVYCWGHNDRGQLGDDTKTDRAYPVRVLGIP